MTGGVRTLIRPDRRWPVVAAILTVASGHQSDPDGRRGRAHLWEHLLMRQRPEGRGTDLFDWVSQVGGIAGATTFPEHTVVSLLLPPAAAPEAIDRLRSLAAAPLSAVPSPATLAAEIDRIEEEIQSLGPARGFPWGVAGAALFGGSPALMDGYGDLTQLREMDVSDLSDVGFSGAVLSLAGDLDPVLSPSGDPLIINPPFPYGTPAAPIRSELHRAGPDAVLAAFPMPSLASATGAHVATSVLFAVLAHRLIRDGGPPVWVRTGRAGTPFTVAERDLAVALLRGHDEAAARLDDQLAGLAAGELTGREVAGAVREIQRTLLARLDTAEGYATVAGRLAVLAPTLSGPEDLVDHLAAVTPETVSEAAASVIAGPRAEIRLIGGPA